jgi:chorismate mutase/prephenate dehydrogenase
MDIATLRGQLSDIDRQILDLVAQRQVLAQAIGEVKNRGDSSLRSFSQEKIVLERARQEASRLGISEELAVDILRRLIHDSLTLQEQQRVEVRGSGSGRRALVIGGSGRMGAWMTRFLSSQDFEVEVADPMPPEVGYRHLTRWQESDLDHDFIVVATPLRATQEILEELANRRPKGVVFDIGSLKSPLRGALGHLVDAGVQVSSIHPMFGPETDLLSGRHVILVDLGFQDANDRVRDLFGATMAEIVEMPLEDHDRLIAYVLGLSHALNIAFVTALAESGEAVPHLTRLSSTTFDRQLGVAAAVTHDNPHLYFEIQHLNEFGRESLVSLRAATARLEEIIEAGDEEAFVGLMEQGRRYFTERGDRQG